MGSRTFGVWLAIAMLSLACNREQKKEVPLDSAEVREMKELLEVAKKSPQERRMFEADQAWAKFDRLKGQFRSKEMLAAHLMQANQVAQNLPQGESAEIQEHNGIEYRKRLPGLLVAGETGEAQGPDATSIVPSMQATRCTELAETWSSGALGPELAAVGYSEIRCGERTWSLQP